MSTGNTMFSHLMEHCFFRENHDYAYTFEDIINKFSDKIIQQQKIDLYIHIPFCSEICSYCNLQRKKLEKGDIKNYIPLLETQAEMIFEKFWKIKISSLWFGWWTPSLLSSEDILLIWEILHNYFNISSGAIHFFEWYPTNFSIKKLEALKKIGINWLVFPVQTINNEVLNNYNRFSNNYFSLLEKYVKIAKEMWFFVSTDIIFWLNWNNIQDEIRTFLYAKELWFDEIVMYVLQKNKKIVLKDDLKNYQWINNRLLYFLNNLEKFSWEYLQIWTKRVRSTYYFRKNLDILNRYSPSITKKWSILTLWTGVFWNIFWQYRFFCKDIVPFQDPKFHLLSIDETYEMLEFFFWKLDLYWEMLFAEFAENFQVDVREKFSKEINNLIQLKILSTDSDKIFLIWENMIKNIDSFYDVFYDLLKLYDKRRNI